MASGGDTSSLATEPEGGKTAPENFENFFLSARHRKFKFFFISLQGQLCQIRKIDNDFKIESGENSELVIEGIFESCDANSTHLIIDEAIIIRVYGPNPYDRNARSELIRRAEKASINMAEVKEIRFVGVNITKDGIQVLKHPEIPV